MKKGLEALFIFLLIPVAFNFFGANFLDATVVRNVNLIFCSVAILLSLRFAFVRGDGFELPVQLICLSIICSTGMAYLGWAQGFSDTLKATIPLLLWIFFFWLLYIKIPVNILEAIVLTYTFIYIVLYLFQFFNPGTLFFGEKQQWADWYYDRGIFRIIFPGGGIFFLGVFIAINKFTAQRKNWFIWLFFLVAGLIIPVMQATRTYIAGVILIYLYHFLRNQRIAVKLSIIAGVAGLFFLVTQLNIPVIKGLMQAQEETKKEGLQNQRIVTATYFITDFSPNAFCRIMGNGAPADQSQYGKQLANLKTQDILLADVGIIGMFTMFGILSVAGYLLIWIKSFMLPLPKNYVYPKYYLWFLLVTSLTYDAVYGIYFLIATVFALYIFQVAHIYEKTIRNNQDLPAPVAADA